MRLFESSLAVRQVVVDDLGVLGRERVQPGQALPLAPLERGAGDKLGELRRIGLRLVQRHDQVPVPDDEVSVGNRLDKRVVRLFDLAPLSRRQRPVIPLHLVDVDPAPVNGHEDIDAPVAPSRASTCGPLVAPAEQDGHDGFDVLTRTADQGAGHGTTSYETEA